MSEDDFPPLDPAEPENPKTLRTVVWVRVLLFTSIALNLLIVGLVVGSLGQRGGLDRGDAPRLRDVGLGPLASVLSSGQRKVLREELRRHKGDLRENREKMRKDIKAVLDALRSEPFDADTLSVLLQNQRETAVGRQKIGHRGFINAVTLATPSERKVMADRLERALSRAPRRKTNPDQ